MRKWRLLKRGEMPSCLRWRARRLSTPQPTPQPLHLRHRCPTSRSAPGSTVKTLHYEMTPPLSPREPEVQVMSEDVTTSEIVEDFSDNFEEP